jgi:hypothetical protein
MAELKSVVTKINGKLATVGAGGTRDWVHKIQKTHPTLDSNIAGLEYFKPISNEIGVTYLRHTPDTQTLALQHWSTERPNPFRQTLRYKMDGSYDAINKAYYGLNRDMAKNISTEYFYETDEPILKDQNNNYLDKTLLSNDYHIAGDYTFAQHPGLLSPIIMAALTNFVGGAGKLINWLVDVNSYKTSISNGQIISVEGNQVVVNLKGDKVGVIATVIDTTPISSEACD